MFVTSSDFQILPHQIPNLDNEHGPGASFQDYVDRSEEDIVRKLLGSSLYDQFIAGLAALPNAWVGTNSPGYGIGDQVTYGISVWESLTANNLNNIPVEGANWTKIEDNRWLKLREGDTYEYNGKEYAWVGMVKMLTPYIFQLWLRDTFDNHNGSGISQANTENANVISPKKRIVRAYNLFSEYAGFNIPEYHNWFVGCDDSYMKDTLYGYLSEAGQDGVFDDTFDDSFDTFQDYLDFVYKDPGLMNEFNI